MNDKKRVHRQSNYFTIMIVPDATSSNVKSIRIAHWTFHAVIAVILCTMAIVSMLMIRNVVTNNKVADINQVLETTERKKESLQELVDDYIQQVQMYTKQDEKFNEQIKAFKTAIEDAENRINMLEESRDEFYRKMGDSGYSPVNQKPKLPSYEPDYVAGAGGVGEGEDIDELNMLLTGLNAQIAQQDKGYDMLVDDFKTYDHFRTSFPNTWPVRGKITSEEGYRSNPFGGYSSEQHDGMDIAVPHGTSIKASGGGKVLQAEYSNDYGNLVVIDHGYGIVSYYGHNSELLVERGQIVAKGDVVAKAGSTGRSTGPHCHFEIRVNGVVENPRNFLGRIL